MTSLALIEKSFGFQQDISWQDVFILTENTLIYPGRPSVYPNTGGPSVEHLMLRTLHIEKVFVYPNV